MRAGDQADTAFLANRRGAGEHVSPEPRIADRLYDKESQHPGKPDADADLQPRKARLRRHLRRGRNG